MSNQPPIARARYYPLQPLRPADLTDEQAYHIAMRRRHNLAAHPWGILYGLDLAVDASGTNPVVRSGMAVDGYGRDIVLLQDRGIDPAAFDRFDDETLDVFLQYDRQPTTSADTSEEAPPLGQADRETEVPRLVYSVPVPPPADRRSPRQVPPGDLDFGPDRNPADDPARSWPVFLGQVTRITAPPPAPTGTYTYQANPTDRPYAGLVAADVVGPSDEVLLRLGTPSDSGVPRFAVYVAPSQQLQADIGDPASGASPGSSSPATPLDQTPSRLAIDGDGAVTLAGTTTVAGDLTIDGGALEFGDIAQPDPDTGTTVPTPGPWTIYRRTPAPTPDQPDPIREMRVVIDPDGALVVGAFGKTATDPKPSFRAALTVADGTVTVAGNLRVLGAIRTVDLDTAPLSSPGAQSSQIGALLSGISASDRNPAATAPDAPIALLGQLLDGQDNPSAIAAIRAVFQAKPARIAALIQNLLGFDDGKSALVTAVVAELAKP